MPTKVSTPNHSIYAPGGQFWPPEAYRNQSQIPQFVRDAFPQWTEPANLPGTSLPQFDVPQSSRVSPLTTANLQAILSGQYTTPSEINLPSEPIDFSNMLTTPGASSDAGPWISNYSPQFDFSSYLNAPSDSLGTRPGFFDLSSLVSQGQMPDFGSPAAPYSSDFLSSLFQSSPSADYLFGSGGPAGNFGQPGVPDYLAPSDNQNAATQAFIDSLFAPQSSSDYLFGAGGPGPTEALTDFNAANNQFGEGNWYYDANGNIVPAGNQSFQGSQTGATAASPSAAIGPAGPSTTSFPQYQPGIYVDPSGKSYQVSVDPVTGGSIITPITSSGGGTNPFGSAGSGSGAAGGVGPQFSGSGGYNLGAFSGAQNIGGGTGQWSGAGLQSAISGMISAALNQGMPLLGGGPPDDPMGSRGGTV